MKKNRLLNRIALGIILAGQTLLLGSCDQEQDTQPKGSYETGVFIVNEGAMTQGNGSISFYNRNSKTVEQDIFKKVNNRPTGDVVQSLTLHNEKAYIVANNSNKVEVADANTFASLATIEGLALPRFFAAANNKGYVSEYIDYGVSGRVSVIDLTTHKVVKAIAVGELPEQVLLYNGKLYVANSGDNTVTVINTSTDAVEATLAVGDSPKAFVVDANNKIWVLCGGNQVWTTWPNVDEVLSTPGRLIRLHPGTHAIEANLAFNSKKEAPGNLAINKSKNKLYYSYQGKVFQLDITAAALPANALISRDFYGFGVDPVTDLLYGSPGSFTANSQVIRYTATGTAIDSFQTGIGTNGFTFR